MIDTKALREKILDLAIRGKLVPQDPNDEPASVLLERIRTQKEQMVKEGKLKAKDIKNDTVIFKGADNLHYEKFQDGTVKCVEDEVPFELPEGWAWERLSNIANFSGGKTPSTSVKSYWGNDVLWVTAKDMKTKYITTSQLKLSYTGAEQLQLYPQGTILLVVRSGILRHALPVSILKEPATVNQDLKAILFYIKDFEEYFYMCLKGMEKRLLHKYTKAGATVENINFGSFQKILIPIAPFSQIPQIIESANDILAVVDSIEFNKENLEELISSAKSKILDLAIRGKLVPQDPSDEPASVLLERIRAEKEGLIKQGKIKRDKRESIIFKGEDNSYYQKLNDKNIEQIELPFDLPHNWMWATLSMIGVTNIGLTYKPTDITETGTPVLRSNNIINGKIDLSELIRVNSQIRENRYMQKNDILICSRNGSKALVGKCAIFDSDKEETAFGAFMAVYRSPFYKYVYFYMNSLYFRSLFENDDSKQINQLTQDMIKTATIPLPPFSEQQRIVEAIET